MTREEAIKTLKENYCAMCAYGSQDMDSCDIRSCDNKDAIKALEQEPTTKNDLGVDCIDRTELLKAMDTWDKFRYSARYGLERLDKDDKDYIAYVKFDDMVNCVKGMSSVTPQESRWIPVSERLPKKNVWVLVTFKMANGKNSIDIKRINQWNGQWEDEIDIVYNENIIAWMPLPKAYREVEE